MPTPWSVIGQPRQLLRAPRQPARQRGEVRSVDGAIEVVVRPGTITVRDHGAGIVPQITLRVFDRFYRAPSARRGRDRDWGWRSPTTWSTGHGGSISASNHPDGGAVITISLPTVDPGIAGSTTSPAVTEADGIGADVSPDAYLNPIARLHGARTLCPVAPRPTSRTQPTADHRDAGRERLGRLTGWIAAGGIAGVGIFSVVAATSAPAKTRADDADRGHTVDGGEAAAGDRSRPPCPAPRPRPPRTIRRTAERRPPCRPRRCSSARQPPVTSGRRHHQRRRGHHGWVMSPPVAALARSSLSGARHDGGRRNGGARPRRRYRGGRSSRSRPSTSPAAGSAPTAGCRR